LIPDIIVERHGSDPILWYAKVSFISIVTSGLAAGSFAAVAGRKHLEPYIAGLKKFMPLIRLMVSRDYKSRYKRSVLGILWSLLNPLMTMLVMTLVFSQVFRFALPHFPVYLLSGSLLFMFFAEATGIAIDSIAANRAIITKVYVPKYIFPATKVFSSFVNLAFSLTALVIIILLTGAPFHWTVFLIPIPLFYLFVFTLGLSMLLSSVAVFFKDIKYLYGIFLTALQYLTPIFWPLDILPEWARPFMGLNPMFQYISYFRNLVLHGVVPDVWANVVCISFALFFLFLGTLVFMSQQDKYILHI
jgi:ABC-type polysaccharide/polyol phosphate export permease